MTVIYATPDQLANWAAGQDLDHTPAPDPVDNAALLLRSASALVAQATRAAVYEVTDSGLPVDPTLAKAMAEAACATAAAWSAGGIDPVAGNTKGVGPVQSKSGGGVSVTYAQDAQAARAWAELRSGQHLVPESKRILDQAGLLRNQVQGWR